MTSEEKRLSEARERTVHWKGAVEGGDPVRAARRLPVALLNATKAAAAGEP